MTDTAPPRSSPHRCHAIECETEVPPWQLMCRRHWLIVPAELQREVWRHYKPGQEISKQPSRDYLAAAEAAIEAVAKIERPQLRLAL
jgi:hypothetical protein